MRHRPHLVPRGPLPAGAGLGVAALRLLAVVFLLAPGVASAASPTIYVDDAKEYSVAFKAEGARFYVMQLAGTTHCYYTEPHEDVAPGAFTAFPAPKLMRSRRNGFVAGETFGSDLGLAHAGIRAELSGDTVTGNFSFEESLESFHCDTGFFGVPFEASRYARIGSAMATAPARREVRAYYGGKGPIEIFLRTTRKEAGGIRGTFVSRCPVGKKNPDRPPLFRRPAFAELDKEDRFRRRSVREGRTRSGARYKETISLAGRVERDAVTGTYLRVRTTRPGLRSEQRCVTGPIPFRAVRYLPARD